MNSFVRKGVQWFFVREFRKQLNSAVLTSGQQKLKKWPTHKSDPSQSQQKTLAVQYGMERVLDSHWLWAVIIDCNCKEVLINPIVHSGTRYYSSWNPGHMTIYMWILINIISDRYKYWSVILLPYMLWCKLRTLYVAGLQRKKKIWALS
jgi:hypothetical protein